MEWNETIENFSNYLKFERNFSDNTLDAYIRDIKKFSLYAEENLDNSKPIDITYENFKNIFC
jgi:integrase/recombinase XerD